MHWDWDSYRERGKEGNRISYIPVMHISKQYLQGFRTLQLVYTAVASKTFHAKALHVRNVCARITNHIVSNSKIHGRFGAY
jgi:hypothetical protein